MRADRRADRCSAVIIQPGLGTHLRLVAEGPCNGSPLSPARSPSSNASADPHARIFGLSLAALWAACLVLNAASPSTRICHQSDRNFGTTRRSLSFGGGALHGDCAWHHLRGARQSLDPGARALAKARRARARSASPLPH